MSLADDAKLLLIPTGYKTSKVYSVFPTDGDGDFTFTRSGDASRVNPGGLIETVGTNIPRIDHTGGGCPTLNLEPQRTNLHTYSESSTGKTIQNVTLTDNSAISPNGEFNAIKVADNTVNFRHRFWANNVSVTSGQKYTISFYVKKNSPNRYIYINAGILGTNGSFSLDDQSTTGSVQVFETLNNDWYRIGLTGTAPTTQTTIWFLQMQLGTTDANYIGDGSSFYVWGLQFEQGSYPTSYIKTTSGTVTRQKDQCINGGDSDLFDITEGTFFVDANNFGAPYLDYNMITLSDGGNNFVRFLYESSRIRTSVYNGATQQDYFITGVNDNERNKVAITFKENEFKTYFNGVLKDTDTSGVVPINFDRLNFSSQSGTSRHFEGKVYDTRVYDRVLTEAEAIELTTL